MDAFDRLLAATTRLTDELTGSAAFSGEADLGVRRRAHGHLMRLRGLFRTLDPGQRDRLVPVATTLGEALGAHPLPERVPPVEIDPDVLLARMGLTAFRDGQRQAVEAMLDGRDAMVLMPTGGGKSLCYQLPAIAYGTGITVVVSPLIALMSDQHRRMVEAGHEAVMLSSSMDEASVREALEDIRADRARVVFAAPERFASGAFRGALAAATQINGFVVDEAHCISEWGHDFRPDYLRLPGAIADLGRPPVMALTATATPERVGEITGRLGMREHDFVSGGFDRPNLTFDVVNLGGDGAVAVKRHLLVEGLRRPGMTPAIVYCGTRKDTDAVAAHLVECGIEALAYHAGHEPRDREQAQARFMGGEVDVIVATNAFGMGIDRADIRSVWHWAIPTSVEAYYQEAGRAGRDGLPAHAILLAMRADLGRLINFNKRTSTTVEGVKWLVRQLADGAVDGVKEVDPPSHDEERAALAVAERAGAVEIAPAPGGRLLVHVGDATLSAAQLAAVNTALRTATDMGWRAYRSIERYASNTDTCRRRMLLDHFGDDSPGMPLGRCCDVHEAPAWIPDTPPPPGPGRARARAKATVDVEVRDQARYEALQAWRRSRADGKPAYTVATNKTLAAIANAAALDDETLLSLPGIGPGFIGKHAQDLRATFA